MHRDHDQHEPELPCVRFGLDPRSPIWEIDGATTCTIQQSYVPSTPMFVIINTAIGGVGGGTVDNSTLPQAMSVDYVKVTQP